MKSCITSIAILLTVGVIRLPAATITVSSVNDSGPGSLRAALASASNGDTIDATGVSGTILLTSGELLVSNNVTILGPGPANLAVNGNFPNTTNRVFHITNSVVAAIANLTITKGNVSFYHGVYSEILGAGILNDHATLTVSNCAVSGNSAGVGGGIYNSGSSVVGLGSGSATLTIVDSAVNDNSASAPYAGSGGGIENDGLDGSATLIVTDSTVSSNSASGPHGGSGGGIENDGTLTIANSTLSGNSVIGGGSLDSGGYGGAIRNGGAMMITNSTLTANSVGGNLYVLGGGIGNDGTLTIVDSTINGNYADGDGGGIHNGGTLTILHSTIGSNSAFYNGGGIDNDHATLTVSNCTINGNAATASYTGNGGGIFNDASAFSSAGAPSATLVIADSTISGNTAASAGGIDNEGGNGTATVTIAECTISGNMNGGIANYGSSSSYLGLVGSATLMIVNSSVSENSGVGISNGGSLTIVNSTVSDNSSASGPGDINNANGTLEIGNTILNGSACGSGTNISGGTVTSLGYNLTSDAGGGFLTAPGDQINTDPMLGPLQDNGGPTFTQALLPGSPAINKGNRDTLPALATDTDQRGYPRPVDTPAATGGDGSDIGAFETQSPQPAVLSVSACIGLSSIGNQGGPFSRSTETYTLYNPGDTSISWTASKSAPWLTLSATSGSLAPGESTTVIVSINSNANSLPAGTYGDTVFFTNTANGAGSTTRSVTLKVTVTSITLTSTADSGPGTLRDALVNGNLADGGTIDATGISGTISLTSGELLISNSISILGPGPGNLAVSGQGASRVFYIAPGNSVAISGLAITNGAAPIFGTAAMLVGGGIYNDNATLTISNCTLSGNSAISSYFGKGGGIYNNSGSLTIANSAITGNSAPSGGGIYNNSGTLTVTNSTINGNSAGTGGGIYSYGGAPAIVNSTISSNSASAGFGGGIYNLYANLPIANSALNGNSARDSGGAIYNDHATLTVSNSTLNSNSTGDNGGGIYNNGGDDGFATLTIAYCTLTSNVASNRGGAIYNDGESEPDYGGATLTVANSTLSGNSAVGVGGGIYNDGSYSGSATLTIANSTLSGNSANAGGGIYNNGEYGGAFLEIGDTILNAGASGGTVSNDSGAVYSDGYNLSSDDGGGLLTATGDQINTDPMLGPLQDNGGPTFTHALLPGSPAIDDGENFSGSPYDQRGAGFVRTYDEPSVTNAPGGDATDIGAFEVQPPVACSTIVTTTADSGPGSLRAALACASDGDSIDATGVSGTILLTSGELLVTNSVTIIGSGPTNLAVNGNAASRAFYIGPSTIVSLSSLTITNGLADGLSPANLGGGGIYNDHATLTVSNCTLSGNVAASPSGGGQGGGIYNAGSGDGGATLTVINSTLSGNSTGGGGGAIENDGYSGSAMLTVANSIVSGNNSVFGGGGIANGGTLTVANSTVTGNSGFVGGGLYNDTTLTVSNSTVSGNFANSGGGIENNGTVRIANSTVSGNSTGGSGGGARNFGSLTIANSTFSGNSAGTGGSIYNGASLELGSTILKAGGSGANIANAGGTVTSDGYNLSSDDGGGFLTATGDQINTDPMLGPLQDNGGPTLTHALLCGSPAIDAGDPSFQPPPDFDQRGPGFPRVVNGRIDIGAFELQTACNHPPVVQCHNVTVSAGAGCVADASIDNGSHDPDTGDTITLSQSPVGPYPLGATTVTLTVTDNHGTSNSCVATVTVVDDTPPQITCPADIVTNATSAAGAVVTFAPTASDNCSLASVSSTPPSGSTFPIGSTTVTCQAVDTSGLTNTCTFTVQVNAVAPTDSDGDGVPDNLDLCPNTPPGEVVNTNGCSISQLVPCAGPITGGKWRNHGAYVLAVLRTANDFLRSGLITPREWAQIVTRAARSRCGWNPRFDFSWNPDWNRDWDCSRDRNWQFDGDR
ncbi:MAG TPA: choice-of-anchor Q domain-containing protein [Verrucomicrobiae bacterium]|nr:choice-of-anchor Q domain-containing protein [Verrucomicrobiae bacterium]